MIDKEKIKKWVKQDLIVKSVFKEEGWSLKSIEAEVVVNRAIDLAIEKTLKELEAKNEIGGNLSGGGSTSPASTSEEWSLKGKEYDVLMSDYDVELTTVYKKDDIETLRQKLIEDLNNQIKEIGMFPEDTDCRKTCKKIIMSELRKVRKIINKRFGVKE